MSQTKTFWQAWPARMRTYADLVRFEHTIFALPFALSAMLLAAPGWPRATTVLWVLVAMVGGRTYAMAMNRLIDADIDAANPRTAGREIPAGKVKKAEAALLSVASALLLIGATLPLPPICFQLLPLAFLILTGYSFVKRFSRMAHLVLGLALGSSAVGGWLAVTGELTLLPILFGLSVLFWVTGFDIIYACQDTDFDRKHGLHSIPAAFGVPGALTLSKVSHGLCVMFLGAFAWLHPATGPLFWLAVVAMAALLVYEQKLVRPDNLSRLNEAFFTVNGRISVGVFILVVLDKLSRAFF